MSQATDEDIARMISELEEQASHVLEKKRAQRPRRPIVIEFAGSPKSGKSSCIGSLDIFLRRNGFRTKILTERASVCPISGKFDPMFNVWTACASLNQLTQVLDADARRLDVVLLDRGFFDALCWFNWQHKEGFLRDQDYVNFTNFFTTPRFRMMVDLVFLFEVSPERSIEREYRHLLTRKEGSIMRKSVLNGYMTAANEVMKSHRGNFRTVEKFNTDERDQDQVSYDLTRHVLKQIDEAANERIGFIEKSTLDISLPESFDYSMLAGALNNGFSYNLRGTVEDNNAWVQFIPIAVVRDKETGKVLAGMKAKKVLGDKSPERDKVLLYFGGHVRQEDSTLFESPSALDVLKQCVYREVKEEIGIDINSNVENPICVWTRDGTRSNQHIAVIFDIQVDLENVKVTVDDTEFAKNGSGILKAVEPIDLQRVRELSTSFDSWSKNIAERILHIAG